MTPYPLTDLFLALLIQGGMAYLLCAYPPVTFNAPRIDPKPTVADRQAHTVDATLNGRNVLLHIPRIIDADDTNNF